MNVALVLTADAALTIPAWSPPDGYTLRNYEPKDYDEWLRLLLFIGPPGIWSAEKLSHLMTLPGHAEGSWLITDSDCSIVASAYVGQRLRPMDNGEIGAMGGIATHPKHRRRGLGLGVCAAAIAFGFERGLTSITLGTGTDDRYLPARKLYEKLGFRYADD